MKRLISIVTFLAFAAIPLDGVDKTPPWKIKKYRTVLEKYEKEIESNPTNVQLIFAIGQGYKSLRDYKKAIEYYKKALKVEPHNRKIRTELALAFLELKEINVSEELLEELNREDPRDPTVLAGLGRIQFLKRHYFEAEKYYSQALAIDPNNSNALFYDADLLIEQKQYEEAKKILNNLLSENTEGFWIEDAINRANQGPILDKIRLLEKERNYEQAIHLYEELVYHYSDNPEFFYGLGMLLIESKHNEEAITKLQEAVQLFPENARLYSALGFAYLATEQLKLAEETFNQSLKLSQNNADALTGLAKIEVLKGNPSVAEVLYEEALYYDPANIMTLSSFAAFQENQHHYQKAIELYKEVYRVAPEQLWTLKAIKQAESAPYYDSIDNFEKNLQYNQAQKMYELLIKMIPTTDNYLRYGNYLIERHQHNLAWQIYMEGLSLYPLSPQLLTALGFLDIDEWFLNAAYSRFQQAMNADPNYSEARVGMGKIEQLIGNFDGAEAYYRGALDLNPESITGLFYLGMLKEDEKEYSEAETLFGKILEIQPEADWAKQWELRAKYGLDLDEINTLEIIGDTPRVIKKYRELLEKEPNFIEAYRNLAGVYAGVGSGDLAIKVYLAGLKKNPKSLELISGLGLTYVEQGDLEKGKKQLEKALLINPNSVDALASMGKLHSLEGDNEQALEYYERALEIDPRSLLTLSFLGQFYYENSQFEKAQEIYERILEITPNALWAQLALENAKNGPAFSEIYKSIKANQVKLAQSLFLQLTTEQPDNYIFYERLGRFYHQEKEYDKAALAYEMALQIQPLAVDVINQSGFNAISLKKYDEADAYFHKSLEIETDNNEALAGLGRLAEVEGDLSTAESLYNEALESNPSNITALTYLAEMKMDQGDYKEAQKLFKKLTRIDPRAEWAKASLADAKNGPLLEEIKQKTADKDYEGAEDLWKQLVEKNPKTPQYYLRFGFFYQAWRQYQKALDIFSEGLQVAPKMAQLYAGKGLAYISLKKWKESKESFKEALKYDPANADAYAGLGFIALKKGKLEQAETLIGNSLAIDPNLISALSAQGKLRIKQKRYSDAERVYKKLLKLRPEEKWVRLDFDFAKYGATIDEIKALAKDQKYDEGAKLYTELTEKSPENPYFFLGLGQMYILLKQYPKAAKAYQAGLKDNEDMDELLTGLGFAYMFMKQMEKAKDTLWLAIKHDDKNPEAYAGLGYIETQEEDFCKAEEYLKKALEIEHKNQSALHFLGSLYMLEKRYDEAYCVYSKLMKINPKAAWVRHEWKNARDGRITDCARYYSNTEQFCKAIAIYKELIELSPDDPGRYSNLASTYVDNQQYCLAFETYQAGLEQDPDAMFIWRGIGNAYLQKLDFEASRCVFLFLLEKDPEDYIAWAGLGQIEASVGSACLAEEYLTYALSLDPKNLDALSYLSSLKDWQQYHFSALEINEQMVRIDPDPKWIRRNYYNSLFLTCPTITFFGGFHNEKQWDPQRHRWSADYSVYGERGLLSVPVNDELYTWCDYAHDVYQLRDLLQHFTIYSFNVERSHIGARYVYNPSIFFDASAGLSYYSKYAPSSFSLLHGIIPVPKITMNYHDPLNNVTAGILSDADLVARDFNTNRAKVVGRYWLDLNWERRISDRSWFGVQGDAYWYHDFVDNTSQSVYTWLQWRPPKYTNNLLFRYQAKYQRFAKNIPDYYTYKDQIINQFQLTLQKDWRVLWADYLYTSLTIGHGWQDTYTRYAQIIEINPSPLLPPLIWDRRQFNIVLGNLIYRYDRIEVGISGDYYRDTEKYTMWSILGTLKYRF